MAIEEVIIEDLKCKCMFRSKTAGAPEQTGRPTGAK